MAVNVIECLHIKIFRECKCMYAVTLALMNLLERLSFDKAKVDIGIAILQSLSLKTHC